ncbi:MAG TPA: hypothetical protein VIP48_14250 [Streptosporangiaceae bacterium]
MMGDLTQSTSIAPPEPGVLQAIRPSAARLTRLEDAFAEQLHYEVSSLIPDLPSELSDDDWSFCQRTVQALLWGALTDEPAQVVAGALRRLGAVNELAGFPRTQYLSLAHALLRAVRELAGDEWSTTLGSAWISYFQWIQGHLVTGAQEAPRPTPRPVPGPASRPARPADPPPGGLPQLTGGEADQESVAGLLDDEDDDEDTGYGQIMVSMTRGVRRDPPPHPE